MFEGLLILPVIVPMLFWAVYHYHKDRPLPEPPGNLLLCFVLGVLAAGLSKGMYMGAGATGAALRCRGASLARLRRAAGWHHLCLIHRAGIRRDRELILPGFSNGPGIGGTGICGPGYSHPVRLHMGALDHSGMAGNLAVAAASHAAHAAHA